MRVDTKEDACIGTTGSLNGNSSRHKASNGTNKLGELKDESSRGSWTQVMPETKDHASNKDSISLDSKPRNTKIPLKSALKRGA